MLAHSVPSKAVAANDRGPVDPAFRLPFITLVLKPSTAQQADLERLLGEQTDRTSPYYRKWLTPEQFGERFALPQSDYAAFASWLESREAWVDRGATQFEHARDHRDRSAVFRIQLHRIDELAARMRLILNTR